MRHEFEIGDVDYDLEITQSAITRTLWIVHVERDFVSAGSASFNTDTHKLGGTLGLRLTEEETAVLVTELTELSNAPGKGNKAVISFTGLLRHLDCVPEKRRHGLVVDMHDPNILFIFGCTREHVLDALPEDFSQPVEFAGRVHVAMSEWIYLMQSFGCSPVTIATVCREFQEVIRKAEQENRVAWRHQGDAYSLHERLAASGKTLVSPRGDSLSPWLERNGYLVVR